MGKVRRRAVNAGKPSILNQIKNTISKNRRSGVNAYILPIPDDPVEYEQLKLNPFRKLNLLSKMLPFLKFEELKNSRFVCKSWNSVGLEVIAQSQILVRWTNSHEVAKFYSLMRKSKSVSSSSLPFFTKFHLKNSLTSGIKEQLTKFGSYIKVLHLSTKAPEPRTTSVINLHNIGSILNLTPNLEDLTLIDPVEFHKVRGQPPMEITKLRKLKAITIFVSMGMERLQGAADFLVIYEEGYKDLFLAAPNLNKVMIYAPRVTWISITPHTLTEILKGIPTLKYLTMFEAFNQQDMLALAHANFQLEALKISDTPVIPTFLPFLNSQANTIKDLTLTFSCLANENFIFRFPSMPSLEILSIHRPMLDRHNSLRQCQKVSREQFPKLKKLSVTDLEVPTLQLIFDLFHFVEDVKIISYRKFPELDINSVLIGVPCPNWVQKCVQMGLDRNAEPMKSFMRIIFNAASPNLFNFTNLKRLELNFGLESGLVQDSVAVVILLCLPALEFLKITDSSGLSPEVIQKLKDYHNNVFLL